MGTKYSTVTVSGYNSSPPSDDGSQTAANQVKWSTIKTKLPDPLKTAIESINSQLVTSLDVGSRSITTSDTSVAGDHMKTIEIGPTASTSVTVSLGDAATMAAGYIVTVKNSSANSHTVGRITAGDKIDGVTQNITLPSKGALTFVVANTASDGYLTIHQFGGFVYDKTDPRKVLVWSASNVSSGSTRIGSVPNYDFFVMSQTHGADIASPASGVLNLNTATGDLIDVTGTNSVTAITLAEGKMATLRFAGALILAHGASLVLPGAANITTAAGDFAIVRGYAAGVVRCVSYVKLDGTPVVNTNGTTITLATEQNPTASTVASVDFTGIPSWVKRITIMFEGVSTSGTSIPIIQIGDAGDFETSGYVSNGLRMDITNTAQTAGYALTGQWAASLVVQGHVVLTLKDSANNTWTMTSVLTSAADFHMGGGNKSLSATLDRVRITTVGGTDTFDVSSSFNILYE